MESKIAIGLSVVALLVALFFGLKSPGVKLGVTQTAPVSVSSASTAWDSGFFWGSLEVAGTTYLKGTVNSGSQIAVNGTATTTEAIGSSASGSNVGKQCLWNGTNYTVQYFASNSTTVTTVTSTVCQ